MSLADAIEGGRWASHHYAQITTGTGCAGWVDGTPGHTIEDAVRDLVGAFEQGQVPDPMTHSLYYNIKRMQEVELR